MKHCDTQQVPKNVSVFDGQVMLITDRDKSRAIRGLGRKVARFLPERVGKMMVALIAWFIPFEEMLHHETGIPAPSEALSSYLWKDGRKGAWETPQLSKGLASLTGQSIGVELMVSDYRHVAIGLARKIKELIIRKVEVDMGESGDVDEGGRMDAVTGESREKAKMDYIWDLQSTHGSAIARGHYAVDVRFPNQLQPEMLANYREISRLWHRFLERCGSNPSAQVKAEEEVKKESVSGKRKRTDIGSINASQSKRVKVSVQGSQITAREMQDGLERMLGRGARWRSVEQEEAVQKMFSMEKTDALIIVLPTGAGKSVLFMLPALLTVGGTYVVVVPFSALMDDIVDRARASSVDCIRWKPAEHEERERPVRVAQLVVVSADVVITAQFCNYMDSLRARKLLRGIFVDECYTIIMDILFRRKLQELKGLYRFDCPVILLTATLPGMMERWFRQSMLVEDAPIVRASTVKRNIRYSVVRVVTEGGFAAAQLAVDDEVVRVMLRMEKGMTGVQKGVIYCRSRQACERIAVKVGCDFYHSGIMDAQERQRRLGCWVTGQGGNRWIVATTGLGTGIDISGIVGVIHMEQPYGLVDFIQQTGRGGRREGEIVDSVIVMDQKKVPMEETRSDVEHWNHQAMEWFVESVGCRRVPLGTFMDVGVEECGADCEALQCELCDQCRPKQVKKDEEDEEDDDKEPDSEGSDFRDHSEGSSVDEGVSHQSVRIHTGSGMNRLGRQIQEKHRRLRVLRQWLHEVGDDCAVCFVAWREQGGTTAWREKAVHRIQECPRLGFEQYVGWRQQIRFAKYQCCVWCGLAQSFCRGWDPSQQCEQGDKVMPLVLWVLTQPRWRARVTMEFRAEMLSRGGRLEVKEYIQWVQRSRRMYDEDMTNALAVWDMVVQDISEI